MPETRQGPSGLRNLMWKGFTQSLDLQLTYMASLWVFKEQRDSAMALMATKQHASAIITSSPTCSLLVHRDAVMWYIPHLPSTAVGCS